MSRLFLPAAQDIGTLAGTLRHLVRSLRLLSRTGEAASNGSRVGKSRTRDSGNFFPWGQRPPTPALAMFGQYHVHEIPIVASVDSGEEGRSPDGLTIWRGTRPSGSKTGLGSTTMRPCRIGTPKDLPTADTRSYGRILEECAGVVANSHQRRGIARSARRDHRVPLRAIRAIASCGKIMLQAKVSTTTHRRYSRGAVLQDAQKGRSARPQRARGEAYASVR